MKVVVACGGTGGHAFPGLAVAEELLKRGHEVTIWDSGRDVESSVMRNWKGALFSTGARQMSLGNAFANLRAIIRCRREMKRTKPDALLAMGSYSSLAPVLAAHAAKVPVVLHEANTVPGRAVEFLSRYAKAVAISFEDTKKFLPSVKTVHTGLPIRSGISSGKRFDFIPAGSFVVFITGGSQGAHAVNEISTEAIVLLKKALESRGDIKKPLYVIHQTGAKDEGRVIAAYMLESIPSRVKAFEDCMADAFASADLVIARAGASTCFELAECGKPTLFIPLPSAMRNHQHFNAEAFVKKGAADEAIQSKLTAESLSRYILSKYDAADKLQTMSAKMQSMAISDAANRVADLVERQAQSKISSCMAL